MDVICCTSNQSFVDLAKAWWILERVLPEHPELRRYGNGSIASMVAIVRAHGDDALANLLELHQSVGSKFRALTMSMKRNDFLPPDADQPLLAQGFSTTVWIAYPSLRPEVASLLRGGNARSLMLEAPATEDNLLECMPLGDTAKQFDYGRMFIEAALTDDDHPSFEVKLPCLLSVAREPTDWQLKAIVVSQSELVNVMIQPRRELGPTWEGATWMNKHCRLVVKLATRGLRLHIQCQERDYKFLQGLYEHTQQVEASLQPERDEQLVFAETLEKFRYLDAGRPSPRFRDTPPNSCRVSLFEKQVSFAEGSGVRRLHRGHRMLVVTSTKVKTLSSISHVLGQEQIVRFGRPHGSGQQNTLALHVTKDQRQRTMVLSFHSLEEDIQFLSLLGRSFVQSQEMVIADVKLQKLSIEGPHAEGASGQEALSKLGWKRVKVINKDPDDPDRAQGHTVLSENLRICAEASSGIVTDRVNLGQLLRCHYSIIKTL